MKKFKIEYGIVREYDEVTLWFEPIDDDLDALVLRNRSGRFFRYSQSRGKKEEKEATRRLMLSVYWRRPEVAEEEMQSCPGELGGRQGRGEQYGTIFPMGAAGSRPAGRAVLGNWVATKRGERQTDVSPSGGSWTPDRPGAARAEMRAADDAH